MFTKELVSICCSVLCVTALLSADGGKGKLAGTTRPFRVTIPLDPALEVDDAIIIVDDRQDAKEFVRVDEQDISADGVLAALDKKADQLKAHPTLMYRFNQKVHVRDLPPVIIHVEEWCVKHDVDLIVTVPSATDRVGMVRLRVLSSRSRFLKTADK